jgi:hypothetical protein
MIKKLLLVLFLLILSVKTSHAKENYKTDMVIDYDISEEGITDVKHSITIENVSSELYSTSYSLVLDNIIPLDPKANYQKQEIDVLTLNDNNKITLRVNFPDSVAGIKKARNFEIIYKVDSIATRAGEVWEISIPRLSDASSFRSYLVRLSVPQSFGNEAFISPKADYVVIKNNKRVYTYSNLDVKESGINLGFGEFQVFSFNINYHLENPLKKSVEAKIAIPPDTAFQKVFYESINPLPKNIERDQDGNWLAEYLLEPRDRIDIKITGNVEIFSKERDIPLPSNKNLNANLNETEYWQTNSQKIKDISQNLNSARKIYDFVVENLKYDYKRVRPNVDRLGSVGALENKDSAICMEFTDLFITLARSSGIPAREINGFAYTESPEIQPLSLVSDVLHAWPEYWDSNRNNWIPVDPTWGSTTGGVDYFNKLDLRHFTFVIHGIDDEEPYSPGSYKLGPNPQKDVFVNFGQQPKIREGDLDLKVSSSKFVPFKESNYQVTVYNSGPVAFYNQNLQIRKIKLSNNHQDIKKDDYTIEVIPPFAYYNEQISIPFSFLGRDKPDKIEVEIYNKLVELPTSRNIDIIYSLIIILVTIALFAFAVIITLKLKLFSKKYVKKHNNKKR